MSEQPSAVTVIALVLIAAPAMSGMYIYGEMLKGLRRVGWSQLVTAVVPFLVAVALLPVLAASFGIVGVAIAYVSGMYAAALLGLLAWRRALPQLSQVEANRRCRVEWVRTIQVQSRLTRSLDLRLVASVCRIDETKAIDWEGDLENGVQEVLTWRR